MCRMTASSASRWAMRSTTAPGSAMSYARLGGLEHENPPLCDLAPTGSRPNDLLARRLRRPARPHRASPRLTPIPISASRPGHGVFVPPVCTGPLVYTGQAAIAARYRALQGGARRRRDRGRLHDRDRAGQLSRASATSTTKPTTNSSSPAPMPCATEYKAIVDAGLVLQLDDPALADNWDQIVPEPTRRRLPAVLRCCGSRRSTTRSAACRRSASASICAGAAGTGRTSPTSPMRDIVEVMLQINAGGYSFEAGKCAARARMEGVAGGEAARRQADPAGRRQPRDQCRRASRAGRRAHPAALPTSSAASA